MAKQSKAKAVAAKRANANVANARAGKRASKARGEASAKFSRSQADTNLRSALEAPAHDNGTRIPFAKGASSDLLYDVKVDASRRIWRVDGDALVLVGTLPG